MAKPIAIRGGGRNPLFFLMDVLFIAFPLYSAVRIGPMTPREMTAVMFWCLLYYWIIGCLTVFVLSNRIRLSKGEVFIHTAQTRGFLSLRFHQFRISSHRIVKICCGNESFLKGELGTAYEGQLDRFFRDYLPWSFYYTGRKEEKSGFRALALLTWNGELIVAGTELYSQKALRRLFRGLNERGFFVCAG